MSAVISLSLEFPSRLNTLKAFIILSFYLCSCSRSNIRPAFLMNWSASSSAIVWTVWLWGCHLVLRTTLPSIPLSSKLLPSSDASRTIRRSPCTWWSDRNLRFGTWKRSSDRWSFLWCSHSPCSPASSSFRCPLFSRLVSIVFAIFFRILRCFFSVVKLEFLSR